MVRRILNAVLLLLMLAVLELNKNTIVGWAVFILLTAGYVYLREKPLKEAKFLPRAGAWLGWIVSFPAVLILSYPPVRSVPAVNVGDPQKTGVVTVAQGQLTGVFNADKSVEVYAGIPYAQPPVGGLRWREPQDALPWEGVREADTFAPMSMQPTNLPIYNSLSQIVAYHDYEISLTDNYVPPVSEDSLYLNIWKPAGDVSGLPVLVYIHGGSLQTGQPWYADYSGEGLAKQGAVVVNMGYRLGVFGFFADEELQSESPDGTTGNYGLLDQIKALEWVRDNIAAFGGDPGNVTLSGESAGSACVSALCTSPLASGLFRRVIMESSTVVSVNPPHSFRLLEQAFNSGAELKARHNCANIAELRALPAEELVREAYTQHHITVDGYVLTETPYESYRKGIHNEEAILHGANAEESGPFIIFDHANMSSYETKIRDYFGEHTDDILAIYPAATDEEADKYWAEIYGSVFFNYPHYCLDRLAVRNGIPAYEYLFTKHNGRLGCWHSGEMIYCFGNITDGSPLFDANDCELSKTMTAYWLNFMKTGDPNGAGLPVWEQSTTSERLLEFGDNVGIIDEKRLALYEVLDSIERFE
ncbi:MAG: carboxylesterase family protein [Ruminiclostridium sp.]|nr:carboxylesterase family protein [Ruminiclostridium sp.]